MHTGRKIARDFDAARRSTIIPKCLFINPTLVWAIPAVLLGFIATKLDLPLRTLAKRSAVTAGIMIVISFTPLGGFLPLISLAAGQTIHLLTTM